MKTIILDTNFLVIPFQFGIDVFDEINKLITGKHRIVTLQGVIRELKNLEKNKGKDSRAAKLGLELIERKELEIIQTKEDNVDDAIVEIADGNMIVATNDKELIKRLKDKNVKVIYLRGKKRLELM